MKSFVIPQSRIKLVDMTSVVIRSNQELVLKVCNESIESKRYIKQLSYHYNIFNMCEYIKTVADDNSLVLFVDKNDLEGSQSKIIERLCKVLPMFVYISDESFSNFVETLRCDGFCEEIRTTFDQKIDKIKSSKYFFSKLKNLCSTYELTFLDKEYFTDVKNKLIMI